MKLPIYHIDAFSNRVFRGNPAAVCPLESWLEDKQMQAIAAENNLSETAFFIPKGDAYAIRWFSPLAEVDLCGHATLATAFVIFNEFHHPTDSINFYCKSGNLEVTRQQDKLRLNFPCASYQQEDVDTRWLADLGIQPIEQYKGIDTLLILKHEEDLSRIQANFEQLKSVDSRGVIVSAPATDIDFVSRFFAPRIGIDEDPVTGSAHCMLIPYWAERLQKNILSAQQRSARGGTLSCELKGDRVLISGQAVKFMQGHLFL